jgi:glutamate-1-semialdehyde 2,1-aminomutase
MLPAVGQGALAIEIRNDDEECSRLFNALDHPDTQACITAERAFLRRLEGGCHVPCGAKAEIREGQMTLEGMIASIDGSELHRAGIECDPDDAEQAGENLAEELLERGGQTILDEINAPLEIKETNEEEKVPSKTSKTLSEQPTTRHFTMNITKSAQLFELAQNNLVGGVNSPVRAFRGVGGNPLFIKRAEGAHLWDVDGNKYIDFVGSWGPMILGHANPEVVEAVVKAAEHGTSFGAPTDLEIHLAEEIKKMVPSIELVRMVNSGTEATMGAVRLARGFTGRDKIIKFDGCYHGHADSFLVQAGSGALTLGTPDSPGVPAELVQHTLSAHFNDLDSVKDQIVEYEDQIAAIIVEPIAGNMGVIPPDNKFLQGLRNICDANNIVLIFDEVMTGFRVAPGGAQELYDVKPDLTTFGKILGGGLPVGAFGGTADIMKHLAPEGPVYQAGTLSGNPLAMAAGLATLRLVQEVGVYEKLEEKAHLLEEGLKINIERIEAPITLTRVGSMSCLFFNAGPVTNFTQAKESDTKRYALYFHAMLARGVYLAPSQFEAAFLSLTHSEEDIERTIAANKEALEEAFAS